MKNKLISLLTAGIMLASAAPLPAVQATDSPLMDSAIGTLPEWTPMNFIDAMEFYNTYGKTHVEDNFICIVKPMRSDEKDKYITSYSGSMAMINTPACTSTAVFELEIPEQPDPNDEEALAEYEELCNKLGIPTDDYSFFENYANSEVQYIFKVQIFRVLEGHDLTVEWIEDLGAGYKKKIIDTFTFENPSGFIEQTDIYNWLPDCPAEYNWLKSYSLNSTLASSAACVYSNPYTDTPYIAYCADVNASTGASLEMEQNGDGEIEYYMESDCNGFDLRSEVELVDGQSSRSVMVYEPIADGLVDVKWSVGRHWSDEAPFDITNGRYNIKNNCSEIVDCSNGSTIITFIDKATGELIDVPENSSFLKSTIPQSPDERLLDELFPIDSNPCVIDSIRAYDPHCSYSFDIRTEDGYYEFEGFEVTAEEEKHIKVNCYLSYKSYPDPILPDGATRVIIYDKDTGELIPDEVLNFHEFTFGTNIGIKNPNVTGGWMYTSPFFTVNSNNFILKNDQLAHYHKYADSFEFITKDQPEVTYYSNESMDLIFRIKIEVSGNINGDGEFNIADAVTLQKWLNGMADDGEEIYNCYEADFDLDNELTVFDLILMRKELCKYYNFICVEPDHYVDYYSPVLVTTEELTVYFGPDKKYRSMYTIPKGRRIYEKGYMDGNNNWMYIEDGLTTGWIEAYDEENDVRNVEFEVYPAKPVIYLYPEQETDVHVELELTEAELSTTYPKYNNGWDVTAYPDGTLINKADGTHHKYLFWDAKNCRTRFDYSKGFCVAGSDTEQFLKEKLTYMGLTEEEMNEFIVYWLPLMEHNAYNFITFQDDEYTDSAKLNITPTPDSICRIFMVYVPLEDAVSVEPQELETFERNGFTVVEWGGAEINANINS